SGLPGLLSAGRIGQRPLRRQFQLARTGVDAGQRAAAAGPAQLLCVLRRRLPRGVSNRVWTQDEPVRGGAGELPPDPGHIPPCLGLALISPAVRADVEEEKPKLALIFGKLWITPLLGPAYTPELGFVIAGGTLLSYRFDDESPRSSAPIALSYSTTGALSFTIKPAMYLLEDQLRVDAYFGAKSMTDNYFGVGYQAGNSTPIGETTTQYHRDFLQLN